MQLVTLGDAALRLSPPGSERLETANRLDVSVTGPECNTAVAARQLGAEATWLSRLPDSPLGRRVETELRGRGVEVVAERTDGRQALAFVEHGSAPRDDARLDDAEHTALASMAMETLPTAPVEAADFAYVSASTPPVSPGVAGATATFLKAARDAETKTVFGLLDTRNWVDVDTAADTVEGLLSAVDVLVATDDAVEAVLGRDGEPAALLHALASTYDLETVAVCRRGDAAVWQDSTVHEVDRPAVDAVDTMGAVDAFVGAFVTALDRDARAALRTAVAADSLARTTPGSLSVFSAAEVERVAATVE